MKIKDYDIQDVLRRRLMEQTKLINAVSGIGELEISVKELFEQGAELISKEWPGNGNNLSLSIQYDNEMVSSGNYREAEGAVTGTVAVNSSGSVTVKVNTSGDPEFSEENRLLIDTLIRILASKVERIESRERMEENQTRLDKAYKLARIGTWEYDMINDNLYWSDITKEVHGFGKDYEPDVESTIQLFKEGFHRDTFARAANDAIDHEIPFDLELKIISGQGDERWIRATGEPEYEDGVCTRFYGISQNVTNRKQAAEDLQLNERRFKALVQDGSDMIAILDDQANYTYVSPTSLRVLGIPPEKLMGKNAVDYIHEDDRDRVYLELAELHDREQVLIKPYRFQDINGNWRWLETTLTNLINDSAVGGYVANSRDVTEQYMRQKKMEGSIKEKETLLAEIHHRIKNNLSVLTGLLQLQSFKENNREVLDRLADSITRIHAMSGIHEQLYRSSNYSKLDLTDRLKLLVLNIQNTFESATKVDVQFECEPLKVDVDHALPCSLILNEVMTNIFKHAFKGRVKGEIVIRLSKAENGKTVLSITDDGVGLPDYFDAKESDSLGMKLIDSLSEQLSAEYRYDSSDAGTTFTLTFE